MKAKQTIVLLYGVLFAVVGAASTVFIVRLVTGTDTLWYLYTRIYLCVLLVYTWYIFITLYIQDQKKMVYPKYGGELISVLIPCYNESPELFLRSINSVIAADGNKEIIVIDDGSTNNIRKTIEELSEVYEIKAHYFVANKGKRHALHYAIKNLISKSDFVVTIDSDTVLEKDALVKIVEPLKNPKIGASTGDVQLLNEKKNLLTRMQGTYYWIGLNIYKKAQSYHGMVVCCSGCLAAYKREIVENIIDEFVQQEFLGEACTHSEDRHLTNLVLKNNFDVIFVPEAISYTEVPTNLKSFLRQQIRWKRGFIRESLYTLSHAWKNKKLLWLQILFWDLTAPFYSIGMRLALLYTIITEPIFFLSIIIPGWIIFMLVRYIFVFQYAKEKILGLFVYMFVYEIFLYWMNIIALFTVKNKSWMTRTL